MKHQSYNRRKYKDYNQQTRKKGIENSSKIFQFVKTNMSCFKTETNERDDITKGI